MNQKTLLKRFVFFLKKEKVYNVYIEQLKNDISYRRMNAACKVSDPTQWLIQTVKLCPHRLILDSFAWYATSISWMVIDARWNAFLSKIKH